MYYSLLGTKVELAETSHLSQHCPCRILHQWFPIGNRINPCQASPLWPEMPRLLLQRAPLVATPRPCIPAPALRHRLTHPASCASAYASRLPGLGASPPSPRAYSSTAGHSRRIVPKSYPFCTARKQLGVWRAHKFDTAIRHSSTAAMSNGVTNAPAAKPVLFLYAQPSLIPA